MADSLYFKILAIHGASAGLIPVQEPPLGGQALRVPAEGLTADSLFQVVPWNSGPKLIVAGHETTEQLDGPSLFAIIFQPEPANPWGFRFVVGDLTPYPKGSEFGLELV